MLEILAVVPLYMIVIWEFGNWLIYLVTSCWLLTRKVNFCFLSYTKIVFKLYKNSVSQVQLQNINSFSIFCAILHSKFQRDMSSDGQTLASGIIYQLLFKNVSSHWLHTKNPLSLISINNSDGFISCSFPGFQNRLLTRSLECLTGAAVLLQI